MIIFNMFLLEWNSKINYYYKPNLRKRNSWGIRAATPMKSITWSNPDYPENLAWDIDIRDGEYSGYLWTRSLSKNYKQINTSTTIISNGGYVSKVES